MNNSIRIAIAALLCVTAVGCKKAAKPTPPSDGGDRKEITQPKDNTGKYTRESLETDACLRSRVIYFDLDKTEIKDEFRQQISCHAEFQAQFPDYKVTLEGNADERGSREYNLGLGERRGNAVQSALSSAGSRASLNVVSYGEERPTCKDHNEGCWSKNRRVEIVYAQ
ncbi:peptidoglycan-associated lipoprotein Pal [Tahibacter amnicola]|uniref:Peptidoglycan-associated lipoprotein n=1 Tax=Tahibacter amnicola TaxID=2976241 RepID=A0ABY6BDK2_9GAMM|nr:peptidoglycan-associated lipoprotein Pal [Tahibacter amnicola]UXI67666.1 peptidoglycan-associated lipoprotein Pal [Tahibacter amnicola]